MLKHQGRRVFAGLVISAALVGCGPMEESAMPELSEEGQVSAVEQGISIISGYDISLMGTGTYTNTGYVLPRWSAPSNHSVKDWIALAAVGSPNSSFVAWQYVDAAGAIKGIGDKFVIPAGTDTSVQYEVRYFLNDSDTLAARSAPFSVQKVPTLQCGTSFPGANVPTAHVVPVGKTAGTVSFKYGAETVKDRYLVYSGATLLFDSGCVSGTYTIPLTFSNTSGQLRVLTQPNCTGTNSTGWSFTLGCAL
jgi:hypothetical protein